MQNKARPGFTLIEIVLAAFIFAVGVLALEATAASALLRMRRSAQLTLAASVARSRLEVLASSRCADLSSGSDTVRTIASAWIVEQSPFPGIAFVTQTVQYALDGSVRADNYVAGFPCLP